MPKIGIMPRCYLTDIAEGRMDLFAWLDDARTLEPEGHELHAAFFRGKSDAYVETVRHRAEALGAPVVSLCYAPDFTQPDTEARAAEVRGQQEAIRLAADLGAGLCRTLSGQRREGLNAEEAIGWVAECIEASLPVAEQCGVKLVIENHYKDAFWTYPEFAQKAEVFLRIVERVRSPHFGVQFDPSNALLAGDDPIELLGRVKGRLVSMHASDRFLEPGASLDDLRQADGTLGYSPRLRHGEIGKGLNDYDAIFTILRDIRYDGWITVENGDTMESMRNSIRFLKGMRDRYFGR
ncbi:MAG TPA: sugar phosphate isomerase/epimerase family protein [Planctomycetota bacterium]|nr:sugar phosphate isomerase/epimerase family protein [Planctomycetota bacterium]